jgi:hypothetical protein
LYPATDEVLALHDRDTVCWEALVPDPVKVSTAGVLAALLASETLPDAVPLALGAKVRVTEMLCPAEMVFGRDSPARVNSEFVVLADEMVTLDPVAERVAVSALLLPTVTLPKFKVLALEVSCPAETPVPDSAIVREEFEAFELTVIPPLELPPAFGVKATVNVTFCPLFNVIGRLSPLRLNPVPLTFACEIVNAELPALVKVSYFVCLLPTWTLPKLTLDGLEAIVREADIAGLTAERRHTAMESTKNGRRETTWGRGMGLSLRPCGEQE